MTTGRFAFGITVLSIAYGITLFAATVVTQDWDPVAIAIYVQPLVISVAFFALLRRYCTVGDSWIKPAAWAAAWVYLVWTVIAGFSLSSGGMIAAVLLLIAVANTPQGDGVAPSA